MKSAPNTVYNLQFFYMLFQEHRMKQKRTADLADVYAGHLVSLSVPVAELCHSGDGVQAGILSQRRGDHLECITVRPHAVRLHAAQSARILCKAHCQLDLWSTATSDQSPEGRRRSKNIHGRNYTTQKKVLLNVKRWKHGALPQASLMSQDT